MTDKTKDKTKDQAILIDRNKIMENLASEARMFPAEYIRILGNGLIGQVREWMIENQVPENILEAFDLGNDLHQKALFLQNGELCDVSAEDLFHQVPEAVAMLWTLGANFYTFDGDQVSNPKPIPVNRYFSLK